MLTGESKPKLTNVNYMQAYFQDIYIINLDIYIESERGRKTLSVVEIQVYMVCPEVVYFQGILVRFEKKYTKNNYIMGENDPFSE